MKLFILAALIAVSSAARLEHLERGYLPPDQAGQGQLGGRGQGGFSQGSNSIGFGSHGAGFGSHGSGHGAAGDSAGFGSAPQGSRAGAAGVRGVSSFEAAQSNQYLPPDHGPSAGNGFSSGSHGQDSFGASSNQNQFGAQSQFGHSNGVGSHGSHGFGSQGSNGFGSQGSNGFGSHGSHGAGSHGSHGSSHGSNGFSSQGNGFDSQGSGFGSQGSNGFGSNARSQQQLRQYLAPKTSSSFDKIPQQAFDEETGYHY